MEPKLERILGEVRQARGTVLVLTGAGISAESGIPTFRGKEGYWVVGSRNYLPQEMATHDMFLRNPEESWRSYLYRFGVVRHAEPNAGHRALVALEQALQDRFTLV
ncbi:MAG TPA: Sir2 family NAD-dependent protein deacetylase, partial [Anaeromyxobacteraceae bacterium]